MQRSGSQKALLVLSIIQIVLAAFMLILGLLAMAGGAMVGSDPQTSAELASEIGIASGEVGGTAAIAGLILIVSGAVELIVGILGVRAANNNQKIMPVWVLAIISLVLNIISAISTFTSGGGENVTSTIASVIMSALILWIANNVKKEAGK